MSVDQDQVLAEALRDVYVSFEREGDAAIEGATHARTRAGLIVEQRDYWDLLSSLAQSLPIVRSVYASLAPLLG